MSLRLILVTQIWKSKEMILREERVLEQDMVAIKLPARSGKLSIGLADSGEPMLQFKAQRTLLLV